jgi:hypothetical protein
VLHRSLNELGNNHGGMIAPAISVDPAYRRAKVIRSESVSPWQVGVEGVSGVGSQWWPERVSGASG